MQDEMVEVRATIKGHVQGVGFRVTARQLAMQLGLVGTVRNLVDGRVEICVLGTRSVIQRLLKALTEPQGPGKVSAIFSEEVFPQHSYKDFKIIS